MNLAALQRYKLIVVFRAWDPSELVAEGVFAEIYRLLM